jgi:hypothetical protein
VDGGGATAPEAAPAPAAGATWIGGAPATKAGESPLAAVEAASVPGPALIVPTLVALLRCGNNNWNVEGFQTCQEAEQRLWLGASWLWFGV